MSESPHIEFFGDGITNRIGIWLEIVPDTPIPPDVMKLAHIATRTVSRDGRSFLEIATGSKSLQRPFYHFSVAVADRMLDDACPAMEAVAGELQCFGDLLQEKALLGIEQQIGLLGELLVLERLLDKSGETALDSWLGPMGEPHDFRISECELEVKTTLSTKRIHTINGTEQLVPSKGCILNLVSVLLGPPGKGRGFSLAGEVERLAARFSTSATRLTQFTSALEASGFREADREHYQRPFSMRRRLALVKVDATFPAITRPTILDALGPLASRIEALRYDVNVDGLEREEGTPEFTASVLGVLAQ